MASLVSKSGGLYNLGKVLEEFRRRRRDADDRFSRTKMGYSAPYAAAVHERMDVFHPVGQAKFLEQPLRTEAKVMADIIRARLRARETLKSAQLAAAKHVMRISLQLVPVDTGRLRDSWFIE